MTEKSGKKGYELEEVLRAYFIRAGVYAVRGVPLRLDGDDLTDVDIWLYERPTGSSRRRQIVDAKSKLKPKAVERLFWVKGLLDLLQVDGAYIATTDTRAVLRDVARRLGLSILDGADLKRIAESEKVSLPDRLSEEEIILAIKKMDSARKSKNIQTEFEDLKSSLIDNFGSGTVNRALEHLDWFARLLITCHPNTAGAEIALRLFYLSASFAAIALDFALTKAPFKSIEERKKIIQNVIRYGDEDEGKGLEKVRIATALIERYATNGPAISQVVAQAVRADFARIPADIIADHIMTHLKADGLFRVARSIEARAYSIALTGFDGLSVEEKAFLGVLLDFAGTERASVAKSWTAGTKATEPLSLSATEEIETIGSLFDTDNNNKKI